MHYKFEHDPLVCGVCGRTTVAIEPFESSDYDFGLIRVGKYPHEDMAVPCCSFSEDEFQTESRALQAAKNTFALWKADHRIYSCQGKVDDAQERLFLAEQRKLNLVEDFRPE